VGNPIKITLYHTLKRTVKNARSIHPSPPYAPELNPVEQLWLNIKQRYLSNMAFKDYEDMD
jgi:transposase